MKHNLKHLRSMVKSTKSNIAIVDKLVENGVHIPDTVEHVYRSAKYWKEQLKEEIERLSWLLWPETGRPYKGYWAVYVRPGEPAEYVGACFVNSQERCIKFIERSKFGMQYYIAKFGENHG